jgi:hypothetical protein
MTSIANSISRNAIFALTTSSCHARQITILIAQSHNPEMKKHFYAF